MADDDRAWTVESSRYVWRDRYVRHRLDRCVTPKGFIVDPFHVMELNDWINVVAVTDSLDVVLVREYRHAIGQIYTGLPSGTVDPGDPDHEASARRELEEETGYTGGHWTRVHTLFANPGTQTNRVSTFLAVGVTPTGTVKLDDTEDIETFTLPWTEALSRLKAGTLIGNTTHTAGLYATEALVLASEDKAHAPLRAALRR